jgi:Putative 2/3 transmembrane domain holin
MPNTTPHTSNSTRSPLRMFDWLIAAVLLALLVYLIAPQQLPVSLYKLSLVALAAVAGYWIDRSAFPYARPHAIMGSCDDAAVAQLAYDSYCVKAGGKTFDGKPLPTFADLGAERQGCWQAAAVATWHAWAVDAPSSDAFAAAMLRRAIIMAAAMLAVGLGA